MAGAALEYVTRVESVDAYYCPDAMSAFDPVDVESEASGIVTNPLLVFEGLPPPPKASIRKRREVQEAIKAALRETESDFLCRPLGRRQCRKLPTVLSRAPILI